MDQPEAEKGHPSPSPTKQSPTRVCGLTEFQMDLWACIFRRPVSPFDRNPAFSCWLVWQPVPHKTRWPTGFIVSPLATLAFGLWVVGDTGLKTGWVRRRSRGGVGGYGTNFALSPGKPVCVMIQTSHRPAINDNEFHLRHRGVHT